MAKRSRLFRWLVAVALSVSALGPALAVAGPRSGGSFGGRLGFRSGGGFGSPGYSGGGYGPSYGGGYSGGGSHFIFLPSFGGYGYGFGGGFGLAAPVVGLVVAGLVIASIARSVRANRSTGGSASTWGDAGDEPVAGRERAFLYKLQLALGRSARAVQDRLAEFAEQGDTSTEAGLSALLQQTAVELLRQTDAVRYALADGRGPMSFTNAETAMNGLTLAERGRYQIERVRGVDGRVARSSAPAEEGREALELVVVTLIAATRTPLAGFDQVSSAQDLAARLTSLGSVPAEDLLGLEVVWTPADSNDSMTEVDVMTSYPDLRSL